MASPSSYVVIRLVPEAPVDGATFATYLDGLQLQLLDANPPNPPLTDFAYSSPLLLLQWPVGSGTFFGSASVPTSASTSYQSPANYGTTLTFNTTDGIPFGAYVFTTDGTTIPSSKNLQVAALTETTVQLNHPLPNYVPTSTVVSFIVRSPSGDPSAATPISFSMPTSAPAGSIDGKLLVLSFADTAGIAVGMTVTGSGIASGTTVAKVSSKTSITLSQAMSSSPTSVTFTLNPPFANFSLTAKSGTPTANPTTLTFASNATDGVATGMMLSPVSGLIAPGTIVTGVTSTTVVLSQPLLAGLASGGQAVTFSFPLSSLIAQHTESLSAATGITFPGFDQVFIPAAVATAILPLNTPPPAYVDAPPYYLDVKVNAVRGPETIPVTATFYNVQVSTAERPATPDQYQAIPASDTGLYVSLPPQPSNPITLTIPSDGSPPRFDQLQPAIEVALNNNPIEDPSDPTTYVTVSSLSEWPAYCTRVAYDIVWSYQNTLPAPPDPLESLYTNPPNPGGGGGNASGTSAGENNFEQDRQKFESALSGFYSTTNATAERLTKFVAAVSHAVVCEEASLNSATALVEFPVDPSSTFATEVESELLLEGLGVGGPSGLIFGVPAAFFYVLGAQLDKSTSHAQRFQMATGDAIDRLLQQFATAENSGVIDGAESFTDSRFDQTSVTAFQAARRLVALRVSAASSSPSALVLPDTPLASLVGDWLSAIDPAGADPQNPPLTYQNTDFDIWTQVLATEDPQGYVAVDLDALTQGYVIPPIPLGPASNPGPTTLTFANGVGIGAAMPVTGPNVPSGTTVTDVATTVTLSAPLTGGVSTTTVLVFDSISASPISAAGAGSTTLTFTNGIGVVAGMPVTGPNVPPGTTVTDVATTVTFSASLTGSTSTTTVLVFNYLIAPIVATTTADGPAGSTVMTFAETTGISAGMAVAASGVAAGAFVQSVTSTTVTLSTALLSDVPSGSTITFFVSQTAPLLPVAATTTADCPSGTTVMTFADTTGVSVGMTVLGTNVAPGTTVQAVAATTVTLSTGVTADVPSGSGATFAFILSAGLLPVSATTTADCPFHTSTLTFGSPGGTSGISSGMLVFGDGITPGTVVQGATATTVTLSTGVSADVPGGSVISFAVIPSTLADQIEMWLPSTTSPETPKPTVATVKQVTAAQWTSFFTVTGGPTWLPPFTQPVAPGVSSAQVTRQSGYVAARIRAFVRAVQRFFTVSSVATAAQLPGAGAPPTFALPAYDPIGLAVGDLPGAFPFGGAVLSTDLPSVAQSVLPGDVAAQTWLIQAMTTLNELWEIASVVPNPTIASGYTLPNPVSFSFSLMETLYARGFRTAADVSRLSSGDFQQALTGTVAYDSAAALWAQAQALAPQTPPSANGGSAFGPINPDSSLVNCVPPPCLSPFGPIAYLHEMLTVSQLSTCETVAAPPTSLATSADAAPGATILSFASAAGVFSGMSATGEGLAANSAVTAATATSVTLSQPIATAIATGTTIMFTAPPLGVVLSSRRGPLGDLAASCANLESPLPLIDIVNECLEYMAAAATPAGGRVYETSGDAVAGHVLCAPEPCPDEDEAARCHDPGRLFAALPEYSTPATPVDANSAVEPAAFNNLKSDFSSCLLPYSQPLDVSRGYLKHLGSCRYEEMRTFRKCITEFVLDPTQEPTGFQSWLWRYPVRIDIAMEYLRITPEEYNLVFHGAAAPPCTPLGDATPTVDTTDTPAAREGTVGLAEFLEETCLSYCEFYELWRSGFVTFTNGGDDRDGAFPQCEPCCLDDLTLQFAEGRQQQDSAAATVFIRLWRKLRESCCFCYTFAQLRDICDVLSLYHGGALNPDFVRQLAAFQMLQDEFRMELVDPVEPPAAGAVDADRTHLLALWVGPTAAKWGWAVTQLIERVEEHAERRHDRERHSPEFIKLLAANLDPLSQLAGFDSGSTTDCWHASPTHTLRFAEVLAKIYASDFSVGELIYLFTAQEHLDGDDPFALQDENEALDLPLSLPAEDRDHSLWTLRHELLHAEVSEDEHREWPWRRLADVLSSEFGFDPNAVLALGEHFFPEELADAGHPVTPASSRFVTSLSGTSTNPATWDIPPDNPFDYDSTSQQLSLRLPLRDRAVIAKLAQVYDLNPAEQQALQDLVFQPRAMLAAFALLFDDFSEAQRRLIEEPDAHERYAYFRHQALLCRNRCHLIAGHLARHVADVTGQDRPAVAEAALILRSLAADENPGVTPWESDSGAMPALTWTPPPIGNAVAALLGLTGTGLTAEYRTGAGPVWRDMSGSPGGFGAERDRVNCPVPTVVPAFGTTLTPAQLQSASVHNGFLMDDTSGAWLGGAEGFSVTWDGVLLIDEDGTYEFWAGAPTPDDQRPDFPAADRHEWRVSLRRGQRAWVILSHHWGGEEERRSSALPLKRGVYELTVELVQPPPELEDDDGQLHHLHTGFQIKYCGPDTDQRRAEVPHQRVFRRCKEQSLATGLSGLAPGAQAYLTAVYPGSLRDIRRTYQRAFKALLFARRFGLSAERRPHGSSELGYMLGDPTGFAGAGYYRAASGFTKHAADFDFDFLPLLDNYLSPSDDARTDPSPQRTQAMFDWWERIFDYTVARREVRARRERQLWQLFEEAAEKQPADPSSLLRHMGADARHWELDLRYFQGQGVAVYSVSAADLTDDRWALRGWHADRWLSALECCFAAKDISEARPDLWAADDPSAGPLPSATETGNANLSRFVCDGCLENGEPRRYEDLERLNDGLRERGRNALVAYLCQSRVALPWQPGQFASTPGDLSAVLLLDVEAGVCERASRIEEAITAVQTFVRRSRLGLEPTWHVSHEFARLWDSRFETYRTWERCKRRELYRENWIEFDELRKARRIEAFRFLESELRTSSLTLAAPGGLDWWADDDVALERTPRLIQRRDPSTLETLSPVSPPATREGLVTLGRPESAAQPTWLAPTPQDGSSSSSPTPAEPGQAPSPPPSSASGPVGEPVGALPQSTAGTLARAAAAGSTQPQSLPLWMEAAIKLGTRFVRVAAAGVPQAAVRFVPHGDEPPSVCCDECGCEHPVLVDEYYFWLIDSQYYAYADDTDAQSEGDATFSGSYQFGFQDSYYDQFQQQSAEWNDEDQVPSLLAKWQPAPAVRLAWCRVHNGQFGPPRRSEEFVAVDAPPELAFLGRAEDSLYFEVTGSAPLPAGYGQDTSPPGFRYDLPTDHAVALPQALKPPAPPTPSPYPGGLLSYPFFVYHEPGARLFPAAWFSPSLAVADALRARCGFELALRWYKRAFDPLQQDCAWTHCSEDAPPSSDEIARQAYLIWQQRGSPEGEADQDWRDAEASLTPAHPAAAVAVSNGQRLGACCDSTNVTDAAARHRAVILHYCETLLNWGDALMRRRHSPEAFQQARLLYDTVAHVTGQRPKSVLLQEPGTPQTVDTFVPAYAELNPRLLNVYDCVSDRLELIHDCLDSRRLRVDQLRQYFGDSPIRDGWRTVREGCADDDAWCARPSPYRFLSQIQKALEMAGRLRETGSALLAAHEKGDAEYLAALHAEQDREMQALGLAIRQDQWRDADWQIQALQQTKDLNQANLLYYTNLYQNGLINDEIQNVTLATNAIQTRTGANVVEAEGEIMNIIPDVFVGALSSGTVVPVGTKLASFFNAIGRVMQTVADIQSGTAGIDVTEAGWQRRSDEWLHQMQTLPVEIQQIEFQILGAHRRRHQAMHELNNQQRQIEHATELLDFIRDKFTATDLYLWLQKETAALYWKLYELTLESAREAERAFNFERGYTTRYFIPEESWDDLHEGLMAGDRLDVALRHMEKAYLDENVREYELTKHISLRLHFPIEFLRLRSTGRCEIEIPEWMFDVDAPGMYMRRIKSVALTIPCVTGPYTGVHCRLTLIDSTTRTDPTLRPPPHGCCCPPQPCCECRDDRCAAREYALCPDDPRAVRQYDARQAIATSSGQNDAGLFQLNFEDPRYLPFEFEGAVSRWGIELPPENNYFDFDSLTDTVLHISYTAREGGELLRAAANASARCHLPGDGWHFFDVRHEFPDAWQLLRDTESDHKELRLTLRRRMFPFIPDAPELRVDQIAIVFAACDGNDCARADSEGCPCPPAREPAAREIEFIHGDGDERLAEHLRCLASERSPRMYCGMLDVELGPLGREDRSNEFELRFPHDAGRLERVFLLCRYQTDPPRSCS
jgi:Tc toxin complex TcA C-terminal TcB-binding domain/Protein of unknown function (DUF2934)